MSGHTPGPWWVEERGGILTILGPRENCSHNGVRPAWEMAKIDNYVFWDEPGTEEEDRANARLIASAPDLLAALKALDTNGHTQATWALALRAIAKAEGRT